MKDMADVKKVARQNALEAIDQMGSYESPGAAYHSYLQNLLDDEALSSSGDNMIMAALAEYRAVWVEKNILPEGV